MTWILGVALLGPLVQEGNPTPDSVRLKNGDVISGGITGLLEGVLTVATPYSKEVKIDVAQIQGIATAKAVVVLLVDGELLKGTLVAGKEGEIVVQSELAGPTRAIALANVKAINPPEEKPARYQGFVALGGSHSSGNTDRTTVSLSAEATRRTEDDRISFRLLWNYGEERDRLTIRNTFAGIQYDYFFSKRFYGYLGTELYVDEFKDLDLRTIGSLGAGYQAIDEATLSLFCEAGIAYINENFKVAADEDTVAVRLAGKVAWTPTEGITFSDSLTIYPKFEGGVLVRNEAGVTMKLWEGWALKFSNILDYNSEPPGTTKKSDWLWLLSLTYTFG